MASDEKKKSGKGIIIVVVILLLVIILGAVGGFFIISKMNNSDQPKKIVEEVIQLDDIVVNIKDPSNKKYVKVSLAMTYDSKNKKDYFMSKPIYNQLMNLKVVRELNRLSLRLKIQLIRFLKAKWFCLFTLQIY